MTEPGPVCVVAGVGPGTGAALARRFAAGGYRVALVARSADRLAELQAELPGARAFPADLTDPDQVSELGKRVPAELGSPQVLLHNAPFGVLKDFREVTPEGFEQAFRTNTLSLMLLGQAFAPAMVERGRGAIIVTGNTSALRGKANFAGFAPTKAAQRILAESMARSLGPQGVHVAYVVIDAVIDLPWTRRAFGDRPDDFFARPVDIAETVYFVAHQERSAWTFNVDLRPFGETW